MLIECTPCNKKIDCKLVTGEVIYPHRKDLYSKKFYQCPDCGGYVGTHPDNRPLGIIVSKEIKIARRYIHQYLDPLWEKKAMKRGEAYNHIKQKIGYNYHTAEIKDIGEARKIFKIVKNLHDTALLGKG